MQLRKVAFVAAVITFAVPGTSVFAETPKTSAEHCVASPSSDAGVPAPLVCYFTEADALYSVTHDLRVRAAARDAGASALALEQGFASKLPRAPTADLMDAASRADNELEAAIIRSNERQSTGGAGTASLPGDAGLGSGDFIAGRGLSGYSYSGTTLTFRRNGNCSGLSPAANFTWGGAWANAIKSMRRYGACNYTVWNGAGFTEGSIDFCPSIPDFRPYIGPSGGSFDSNIESASFYTNNGCSNPAIIAPD